jgi:protein SCO1
LTCQEVDRPGSGYPKVTRSYRLGIQIVLGAILIAAVVAISAALRWPPPQRPAAQELPPGAFPLGDFRLVDRSTRIITQDDFRSRVWIVSFIFTRCPLSCPRITSVMKDLTRRLSDSSVLFASVSVDPEFDTPPVLSEFAQRFDAPRDRWYFLTGNKHETRDLIQGRFKLGVQEASPAEKAAGSEAITHSDRLALVEDGQVLGFFESSDRASLDALVSLARRRALPGWIKELPALNASLNGLSAILLLLGWSLIRQRSSPNGSGSLRAGVSQEIALTERRFVRAHVVVMLTALTFSALFLTSYLVYHSQAGSTPFRSSGPSRVLYFTILLSHTALAVAVVPLVTLTLLRAFRRQYAKHVLMAQVTFPIWLYVAITGVIIYLMLYHLPTTPSAAPGLI